jgi:hypothetical protein
MYLSFSPFFPFLFFIIARSICTYVIFKVEFRKGYVLYSFVRDRFVLFFILQYYSTTIQNSFLYCFLVLFFNYNFYRYRLYQLLPFRSEGIGRRILFINVGCDEWDTIDSKIRDKILFYITYIAGRDVNMQREGLVIVSWLDSDFKISNHSVVNLLSVRLSAIHICTNDIPYHGLPRSVVSMMIAQNRSLIKLHAGTLFSFIYTKLRIHI